MLPSNHDRPTKKKFTSKIGINTKSEFKLPHTINGYSTRQDEDKFHFEWDFIGKEFRME